MNPICRTLNSASTYGLVVAAMLLSSSGCGGGGGGGGGEHTIPGEVTWSKSFGGPGEDFIEDVAVDSDGNIVVLGSKAELVTGGYQTIPWTLKLDPAGNDLWQKSFYESTGVVNLRTGDLHVLDDDHRLLGGEVRTASGGDDVVLQRSHADGTPLWSVVLDSGTDDQPQPYLVDPSRPWTDDELLSVLGDETQGWFVIANSSARLRRVSGAVETFYNNVPSTTVWYVLPGGAVAWQRRLTSQSDAPEDVIAGPTALRSVADRNGNLVLLLDSLINARSVALVRLDAANNMAVLNGELDYDYEDDNRPAFVGTSDGFVISRAGGYDNQTVKLDSSGNRVWRRSFSLPGTYVNSGGIAETENLAGDETWTWLAFNSIDIGEDTAALIRLSEDGTRFNCDFAAQVILALEPEASGTTLRVIYLDEALFVAEQSIGNDCQPLGAARTSEMDFGSIPVVGFWKPLLTDSHLVIRAIIWVDRVTTLRFYIVNRSTGERESFLSEDAQREFAGFSQVATRPRPTGDSIILSGTRGPYGLEGVVVVAEIDANGEVEREVELGGWGGAFPLADQLVFQDRSGRPPTPFSLSSLSDGNTALQSQFDFSSSGFEITHSSFRFVSSRDLVRAGDSVFAYVYVHANEDRRSGVLRIDDNGAASLRVESVNVNSFDNGLDDALASDSGIVTIRGVGGISIDGALHGGVYYEGTEGNSWVALTPTITVNGEEYPIYRFGDPERAKVRLWRLIAHDRGLLMLFSSTGLREALGIDAYQNNVGDFDVGLLKLDPLGRPQWLRIYGGGGDDVASLIKRTQGGYIIGGESTSLDAVTPGSQDIWLLKIGPDGRIEGDRNGVDHCDMCIGSLSGEALANAITVDVFPRDPLSEPIPGVMTTVPSQEVDVRRLPPDNIVGSENTAQQCTGNATDLQELPVGAETQVLSIEVFGQGRVHSDPYRPSCGDTCEEQYLRDSTVELTAVASDGYMFESWSGDCSGTDPVTSMAMDADRSCSATFVPESPESFEILILGQGAVLEASTSFRCESIPGQSSTICPATFSVGETVILQQSPAAGYQWNSWGNCTQNLGVEGCSVVVTESPPQIILEFTQVNSGDTFNLYVNMDGGEAVVSTPAGIDCPSSSCSADFDQNQAVTLTATPGPNLEVGGWTGHCSSFGNDSSGSIVMDSDKVCAVFFNSTGP